MTLTYRERCDKAEQMLKAGGTTYKAVNAVTGISIPKIAALAEALNVYSVRKHMRDSDRTKLLEMVEQGKNDTEIAEVIGVHKSTVLMYRRANGIKSGVVKKRELIYAYKRQHPRTTQAELAKIFNCSRCQVGVAIRNG